MHGFLEWRFQLFKSSAGWLHRTICKLMVVVVVVGCHVEKQSETVSDSDGEANGEMGRRENGGNNRYTSLRLLSTDELMDRLTIGMSIVDLVGANKEQATDLPGLLPFSSPYRLTIATETRNSPESVTGEQIVLFFCRTNEMPPRDLSTRNGQHELTLTAVTKQLPVGAYSDEPRLTYILPKTLAGMECTGCAPLDDSTP